MFVYVSSLATNLATARNDFSESSWLSACKPYLASLMDEVEAERVAAEFMRRVAAVADGPEEEVRSIAGSENDEERKRRTERRAFSTLHNEPPPLLISHVRVTFIGL